MFELTITDSMFQEALEEGKKREKGTPYNRSKFSDYSPDVYGFLGELVFREYLKQEHPYLKFHHDTAKYVGGDEYDFLISNKTIDVKTATKEFHRELRVLVDRFFKHKTDFYVGIKINLPSKIAHIYGYVNKSKVANSKIIEYGGQRFFSINLYDLIPICHLPVFSTNFFNISVLPRKENT